MSSRPTLEKCRQNVSDQKRSLTLDDPHYSFGPFRLYPSEQLLLREGTPIPLSPKAFEVLVALVSCHGHLITREMLMKKVWPDSFVEETNLTVNISLLRKMLGDLPDGRPCIATVPKRGYRFDGQVTIHPERNGPSASAVSFVPSAEGSLAVADTNNDAQTPGCDDVQAPEVATSPAAKPRRKRLIAIFAALTILVIATALFVGITIYRHQSSGIAASVHTLAVLPFESVGANPDDQYLGLGLTDALITRLGKLTQIVVRPIGAVRAFAKSADPLAAGRQLDVQAVLDGTVQRVGDRTHVAVHLQRINDGKVLWSESFDEQNSSVFQIEDSISQRLAEALTLHLSRDEQQHLATPGTPNSQAYELYTQGRFYWNKRSVESVQKSIDLFRQAIDIDPGYAAAWSGLADSWILAGSYGNSFLAPQVAMPKAKEAAEKALSLDDSSAEAHTSLAYIHLTWDWDYPAAEREFRRALQINPAYVNAHHWYAHELVALGRIPEAHEESETALGLDPTDVVVNEHMAWHHLMAREYDRSIPQAIKAIELDPTFVQAHRVLALDYLYTGRSREACDEFEKGVDLSHGDPVARAYLARCYALTHREADSRKILSTLEVASTERYISAAEIAAVYAALKDSAAALKWLDKACDERASSLVYLNADRIWDPLRSNPGFQLDLKRVNLTAHADEVAMR